MEHAEQKPFGAGASLIFLAAASMLSLTAVAAVARLFNAAGDVCDEFHESPNNVGGWSIALIAVALTAVVAVILRRTFGLSSALAIAVLMLQSAALTFVILPAGSC